MANVIVVLIIVMIVTAIVRYLIREKKKGVSCIGCPYAGQCKGTHGCGEKKPDKKQMRN